jgi:CRP-like cAMP-binding protein
MPDRASSGNEETVLVVSVSAGDFLFRAGDPADCFFIVSTGQIELLRRGETHGRLALLAPGDLCGEDSAFEGQVRAFDARAITSASLLRVTADMFLDLIRVRPELASAVISWTAARLLQARAACLAMALPSPRGLAGAAGSAGNAGTDRAAAVARFVHVESGSQFLLPNASDAVVGRADPRTKFRPEIELSSVDAHRSLSRRHAVIKREGNGFQLVEEPRVRNGTYLNGARLSPGVAAPLKEGDEVSFGLITTVFRTT